MSQADIEGLAGSDRSKWTTAQEHVFEESLSGERLLDVLNGWTSSTKDATNLDRKIDYAPELAAAAASLVAAGFVDVFREADSLQPLSRTKAIAAVSGIENWWPDEGVGGELGLNSPGAERARDFAVYYLSSTELGESLERPAKH